MRTHPDVDYSSPAERHGLPLSPIPPRFERLVPRGDWAELIDQHRPAWLLAGAEVVQDAVRTADEQAAVEQIHES